MRMMVRVSMVRMIVGVSMVMADGEDKDVYNSESENGEEDSGSMMRMIVRMVRKIVGA